MVSKALCKYIPITFSGQWYSLPDDSGRCHYACRKHLLMHIFEKVNEWKVAEWREERGYINGAVAPTRPTVESLTVTLDHSGCVLHRGTGQREPFCSLGLWLSRGLPLFLIHPKASNELAAAPTKNTLLCSQKYTENRLGMSRTESQAGFCNYVRMTLLIFGSLWCGWESCFS